MNKKYIILVFLASLVALASCKEEEILKFGDQRYLHFKEPFEKKAYRFSFATTPGADEHTIKIPLSLIGRVGERNKEYKLEVVRDGKMPSTISSSSFSLPKTPLFRSMAVEDTLEVKLINTADLKTERLLHLKIAENEEFKLGPVEYRSAYIYVSNVLSQPDWWNADMKKVFLGEYSDIKYKNFIIATGVTDLKGASIAKINALVMQFVYYLQNLDAQGKTLYEADGKTKVLDTVPLAKSII